MSNTLQVRRGANASLPTLNAGELGFSTDTHQVYIGDGATNHELLTSAKIDDTSYTSDWNGVTTTAPSKNAIYDKMETKVARISSVDNEVARFNSTGGDIQGYSSNAPTISDAGNIQVPGGIDNAVIGNTTPAAGNFTTGDFTGAVVVGGTLSHKALLVNKTDAGAANYNPSALTSNYIITVNTTSAARSVIISTEDRDSGSTSVPRMFVIKDINGNAETNNITVSLETSGNIDGSSTFVMDSNYDSITLMVDGTNGFVI